MYTYVYFILTYMYLFIYIYIHVCIIHHHIIYLILIQCLFYTSFFLIPFSNSLEPLIIHPCSVQIYTSSDFKIYNNTHHVKTNLLISIQYICIAIFSLALQYTLTIVFFIVIRLFFLPTSLSVFVLLLHYKGNFVYNGLHHIFD